MPGYTGWVPDRGARGTVETPALVKYAAATGPASYTDGLAARLGTMDMTMSSEYGIKARRCDGSIDIAALVVILDVTQAKLAASTGLTPEPDALESG